MTIRTAIVGMGNIGRACIDAVESNKQAYGDFELAGIITRDPKRIAREFSGIKIWSLSDLREVVKGEEIDVGLLCGGSKNDLFGDEEKVKAILQNPEEVNQIIQKGGKNLLEKLGQGPFCIEQLPVTVDSFDTHPRILNYYEIMNKIADNKGNLAVISTGWDPGIGSEARIAFGAYAVGNRPQEFYGLSPRGGKSMGHSNALLTIPGVKAGIQYTHAINQMVDNARKGKAIEKGTKTVTREVILVLENDTPQKRMETERKVRGMEGYFVGYETSVSFVDSETFEKEHANAKQHDGVFIATGKIGDSTSRHELHCVYESNPHGTAGIMVASARGANKMYQEGMTGAIILPDIPVAYRSPLTRREMLARFM